MNEKFRKIAEAARAEHGWKPDEVRIDEVERLRRPACSFYTVGNTARPLSYQANYALLNDHVVALGDGSVVARILDTCGPDAGADWAAEIVTRFHRDLGSGIVLSNETQRPDITRKLQAAGKPFLPPALDGNRQSLRFLLLNPETYVLYHIEATRTANGPVTVVKTKVLPLAA
jgi:hypothetical protein